MAVGFDADAEKLARKFINDSDPEVAAAPEIYWINTTQQHQRRHSVPVRRSGLKVKNGISGPCHVLGKPLKVPGIARDQFVGLRLFGHQGMQIPAGPHARLSRSSATALPIALGWSLYPLGTSKNIPPSRSTSLASIRFGLRFATTGTSLIEPPESGSYAKTCPGRTCGSLTLWRSSTVNGFLDVCSGYPTRAPRR